MDHLDKDEIQRIIEEVTKDTPYYLKQQKKSEKAH
jgi:hypothetical protein